MKIKRFGYAFLLALLAMCMLVSCNGGDEGQETLDPDHAHSYTAQLVAPTCDENGYTLYTCSCGDSYQDTPVAAVGHVLSDVKGLEATCVSEGYTAYKQCKNCEYSEGKTVISPNANHLYVSKFLEYPTLDTEGRRELICNRCTKKTVETVEAIGMSLPEASDFLLGFLNGTKYTLDATGSDIISFSEYVGKKAEDDASDSEHDRLAFKLAEFVLDGRGDSLMGHLKLEVGRCVFENGAAIPQTFDEEIAIYTYVNGNVFSFEVINASGNREAIAINFNDEFYQMLSTEFGMSGEDLSVACFVLRELEYYIPVLEAMLFDDAAISDDFAANLGKLSEVLDLEFIATEAIGDNVKYTVNLEELSEFLVFVDGKTISEILDELYGEGSGDAVLEFACSVPDKKIGEIVDAAIAFYENYGVTIADTYALLNYIVALGGVEDFDIEALIEENYDTVLADILILADPSLTKEEIKTAVSEMAAEILGSTVDALYAKMMGTEAEFSIIDDLKEAIETLDDAVGITYVLDKNGALVSMNFAFSSESEDAILLRVDENGFKITSKRAGVISSETEISIKENLGKTDIYANMEIEGLDYLDFTLSIDSEGKIKGDFDIRNQRGEWVYEEYYDYYYEEWVYERYYKNYGFGSVLTGSFDCETVGEDIRLALTLTDVGLGSHSNDVYTAEFSKNASSASLSLLLEDSYGFDFNCDWDKTHMGLNVTQTSYYYYDPFIDTLLDLYVEKDEKNASLNVSLDDAYYVLNIYYENAREDSYEIGFKIQEEGVDLVGVYASYLDGTGTAKIMSKGYQLFYLMVSESEISMIIREKTYRGGSYAYDLVGAVIGTITETEDGKQIFVTLKDGNREKLADVKLIVNADEENGLSVQYEILSDSSDPVKGKMDANIITLENGISLACALDAFLKDEEVFSGACAATLSKELLSLDLAFGEDGEMNTDVAFSIANETQENKRTLIVSYDIGSLTIDEYYVPCYDCGESRHYHECRDCIYGSGQLKLTIER